MRNLLFSFLLVVCAFCMARSGYPQNEYSIGPVTRQQAKQAILQWSGRSNLNIVEEFPLDEIDPGEVVPLGACAGGGLKGIHPTAHGAFGTYYGFGVLDPNSDRKYFGEIYVDTYAGAVVMIKKMPVEPRQGIIANMLPPQQAINVARQITSSYFPNIPIHSLGGVETDPKIKSDGSWEKYQYTIYVDFYNRITTEKGEVKVDVQWVSVWMDSWTGELEDLEVWYEPLEINPVPALTIEEAVQSLISYFYGLGAEEVEIVDVYPRWHICRESPNGPQRLLLQVDCKVWETEGSNILPGNFWTCAVDGHTGEIVWGEPKILSMPAPFLMEKEPLRPSLFFDGRKTKANLVLKNEKIYVNVEDIKEMGFMVEKGEEGYTISYKDEKATFPDKELLKRGSDVFIEKESLSKLKGVMTQYNKETKRLHIWVMNEKAYKKGLEDRKKFGKGKSPQEPPASRKGGAPKSSGRTSSFLIGGALSLPVIGYAILKLLKVLG